MNHLHICQHVAEFNCYSMVYKLEKMEDYHLDWEGEDTKKKEEAKLRHEEEERLKKQKAELEAKAKKEEEQVSEESQQVNEIERQRAGGRQNLITLDAKEDQQQDIAENQPETHSDEKLEQAKNSAVKEETTIFEGLVPGLQKIVIRFKPISEPLEKMVTKKKYQQLFDIVSNGFLSALTLQNPEFTKILQPGAEVYQENTHFLIPLELQERADSNKKMQTLAVKELVPVEFADPSQFKFRFSQS